MGANERVWLLLSYAVPREPTANRVYVWRKLKKLGAAPLQDSVWVLPATPHTREQFRWLASEIAELGGETTLWESKLLSTDGQDGVVRQFTEPVEQAYREILAELKRRNADLAALSRRYQQVLTQDYFGSESGKKVRAALLRGKGAAEP